MEKEVFEKEMKRFESILERKGKQVAEEAGIDYVQYNNVKAGRINDPSLFQRIFDASKIVADRIIKQYRATV